MAALLPLFCAMPAAAQSAAYHGSVSISPGYALKYLDEPWEFALSGSAGVFLPGRFSVQPDLMVSRGRRCNQWTFLPNVALDLRRRGKRITPYVIGGVGYLHELDKSIRYQRSEMVWNGGIGARVLIGGRAYVSPEFRVGHLARIAIGIGYLF